MSPSSLLMATVEFHRNLPVNPASRTGPVIQGTESHQLRPELTPNLFNQPSTEPSVPPTDLTSPGSLAIEPRPGNSPRTGESATPQDTVASEQEGVVFEGQFPEVNDERYFDVLRAAQFLGLAPSTIRTLIHRGRLPAEKRRIQITIERVFIPLSALVTYRETPKNLGGRPRKHR